MKTGLVVFGLLLFLTVFVGPACAQQNPQLVPPPPSGSAPYTVPPQVPAGTPPAMMQMPPPGYGAPDPNWQGQAPYGAPQQFVQWGPPQGQPVTDVQPPGGQSPPQGYQSPQQGYQLPPQAYGGPDPGMVGAPRPLTPYERQEAALQESKMVEQLEDVKQQREMEESFRHSVLAEFDDGKKGTTSSGFNGDQSKVKGGVKKAGGAVKTGMRWCAPTASYIGTFFILRGITGGF